MRKTEKENWENGHQVRGGWFHTLNFSICELGVMISWAYPKNKGYGKLPDIEFFRLKGGE